MSEQSRISDIDETTTGDFVHFSFATDHGRKTVRLARTQLATWAQGGKVDSRELLRVHEVDIADAVARALRGRNDAAVITLVPHNF
jgi:hypothetical protein